MASKSNGEHGERVSEESARKERPKKRKTRVVRIVFIVIICVLLLCGVGAYAVLNHLYSKLNYKQVASEEEIRTAIEAYDPEDYADEPETIPEEIEDAAEEEIERIQKEIEEQVKSAGQSIEDSAAVWNIMMVATDTRDDITNNRTDTMMLMSINRETKQVTITSFMRDIYTPIPGCGYSRLNTAYAIAGPSLLNETMKSNFGLDIDNYATVDFFSFVDVINALGGVDVDIKAEEISYLNESLAYQNFVFDRVYNDDLFSPEDVGLKHLNGNQALAYCRIRELGSGDFGRTERQRAVIGALVEKAQDLSLVELYNLADIILPMVTTDLTQLDCAALVLRMVDYESYSIQSLRIPHDQAYGMIKVNGMSVLTIDFVKATEFLQEKIYGITE